MPGLTNARGNNQKSNNAGLCGFGKHGIRPHPGKFLAIRHSPPTGSEAVACPIVLLFPHVGTRLRSLNRATVAEHPPPRPPQRVCGNAVLASVTAVTPCELAPTQLRRAEYASAMVQTNVWTQTCALSGLFPIGCEANVGERIRKSDVQADMVNHMVEEPSNLCEVSSGISATSETPEVARPQTPHAQKFRAVEVLWRYH